MDGRSSITWPLPFLAGKVMNWLFLIKKYNYLAFLYFHFLYMTISTDVNDASFDANGTPGMLAHDPVTNETVKVTPETFWGKNGEGAVTYITNTTPVTGLTARHVVCLTDTVFTTFTRTNSTWSIASITLPAGTLLTGPVTAITLTSGAVAAYN